VARIHDMEVSYTMRQHPLVAIGALLVVLGIANHCPAQRVVAGGDAESRSQSHSVGHLSTRVNPKQWLQNADDMKAELLSNEQHLDADGQIFLFARLCRAFWQMDAVSSRPWCDSSIDKATRISPNQPPDVAQDQFAVAGALLRILGPLDDPIRLRIEKFLDAMSSDPSVSRDATAQRQQSLARNLGITAQNTSMSSESAARTTSASLASGITEPGMLSLVKLRSKQPLEADRLFADSLLRSRQTPGLSTVWAFTRTVFPSTPAHEPAPEEWREKVSQLVSEKLADSENQSEACQPMGSSELSRILNLVLPVTASGIQSILTSCSSAPNTQSSGSNAGQLITSEDYLRAAEATSDPVKRVDFKYNAARVAEQRGKQS